MDGLNWDAPNMQGMALLIVHQGGVPHVVNLESERADSHNHIHTSFNDDGSA